MKIRTTKQTDRTEHILNIIMVIAVCITIAFIGFVVIRHCIELDRAASEVTIEQLRRAGY